GGMSPSVARPATSVAGYPETRGLTTPGSPGSRPPARHEPAESAPRFIESVPDAEIEQLLLDTVTRFGGTGTEDLVKRVSRHRGFQRLGPHIKERIAGVLNALLAAGRLKLRDDDRVWPA